ncbi:MAG TPA: hypothetical protein IGR64_18480 [Leptolyngbyaceae cyanobacterium M65_K2018_010]|nr:hypothetical protein [Leptolyngbyaceae cyanobacterium M65_K2018_010]
MHQPGFRQIQVKGSGLGCWLTLLGLVWLLGAMGLGWLIKSLALLILLVMLTPILAFLGFRFWLRRNLVQAACPVCSTALTGLKGTQTLCPNCGTPLETDGRGFQRLTEEGTIDVTAVDVVEVAAEAVPQLSEGEETL